MTDKHSPAAPLSPAIPAPPLVAWAIMVVMPAFFSTNLVFGRMTIPEVAPFTLAFLRWSLAALILAPVMVGSAAAVRTYVTHHTRHWLLLGFLGMWICGGIVYLALQYTTATNGTLIYTTSPLMVIVLERLFRGRATSWREMAGVVIGFTGVAVIVLKGDVNALKALSFNPGDLLFVGAALSWAVYSMLLKGPRTAGLPVLALFGLVATAGALTLAPMAAYEFLSGARMPVTGQAWIGIGGIVVFSSLLAFSSFQYGVQTFGAATASVFMYLLAPYGVLLAVVVLGEPFHTYHAVGIATVLGGLILATAPVGRAKK